MLTHWYAWPQGDISAEKMIGAVPGVDPARRKRLLEVLDINPAWHMNRVSDGQRRRVQLAMGLLKPFKARAKRCAASLSPGF